jgi:hypothetical protein
MVKRVLAAAMVLSLIASTAAAQSGTAAMPIPIHMKRGSDHVTVRGVLRQNTACCTYVFKAAAGQKLIWSVTGASTRQTIGYPNGQMDGPGLPNPLPLPATGAYVISVSPDLMAEGAFGPFVLKMRIPPLKAK